MRTLDRKLLRDLARMKGQVVTIALVVGCGIASFVSALTTYESLRTSQRTYYERSRFAEVFASLKRAPSTLVSRIREIPGVAQVETRLVFDVSLDAGGAGPPAVARMVSIPEGAQPALNELHLRQGRLIEPGRIEEVLVSTGFASFHRLRVGDRLSAVMNGRRQDLRVAGLALSPEYVFAIRGSEPIPDDRSFAVLWSARKGLEAAFDMAGAFNDVVLTLAPGADERAVIDALDRLLEPYGGIGAIGRADQPSHRFIEDEIRQNQTMATTIPPIFLGVAAFLLNVVLGRLVTTQREQIAALKAVGYADVTIAVHYFTFVLIVVLAGAALGTVAGAGLGHLMLKVYAPFVRMPRLEYHITAWIPLLAAAVSVVAAIVGALGALRGVMVLAPAEAMRPAVPPVFRRSRLESAGLGRILTPRGAMIFRSMARRPVRAALATLGVAFAVAILIAGLFWRDAVDYMIEVQFASAEREDALVAFTDPVGVGAKRELAAIPGVTRVEAFRSMPARLRSGHRSHRTAVLGLPPGAELRRLLDRDLREIELPPDGILLTDRLGERLGVGPGDLLTVDVLEGRRPRKEVAVVGLVRDLFGLSAYMEFDALSRLLGEAPAVSAAALSVDPARAEAVYAALRELPKVAAVSVRKDTLRTFRETSGRYILVFTGILAAFAAAIAVGVVYNGARVTLSERAWELASLRVLGFTRREVSTLLLGELAWETGAAVPLGFLLGYGFAALTVGAMPTEEFAVPLVIEPRTYAFAAAAVLVAATLSAFAIRRRIDRLDLVAVLKAME